MSRVIGIDKAMLYIFNLDRYHVQMNHNDFDVSYVPPQPRTKGLCDIDSFKSRKNQKIPRQWEVLSRPNETDNSIFPFDSYNRFSSAVSFFSLIFFRIFLDYELSISVPSSLSLPASEGTRNAKIIESPLDKMINARLTHVVPQKIYI